MPEGALTTMPVRNTGQGFTAYDQFDKFGARSRKGGGIPGGSGDTTFTQYGRPLADAPKFLDVLAPIYARANLNAPGGLFQQGVQASTPSQGISPQTQQILNIIKQQQDYAQKQGISQAQALAGRRGIAGSSAEQFGVQSAIEAAARSGQEATQQALGQDFQAQQALQQLQAQGYFQGAGQELTANTANAQLAANLTSDELASLRGITDSAQNRALQERLGVAGVMAQNYATEQARRASDRANSPGNILLGGIGAGIGSPF